VAVIGAALDLGQGRRGVDMGPSAIRYGGLVPRLEALGHDVRDRGNLSVEGVETLDVGAPEARYLDAIMRYGERLAAEMVRCVGADELPLVLGGDHSLAIGVLGGLARAHGDTPGGLLWLDAHGDLNVPGTSPSGNVHGMPLAAALGHAPDYFASDAWPLPMVTEAQTTLLGVRSLDPAERALIHASDLTVVTMPEIDRSGLERCLEGAIERLRPAAWVHVSLDLDVVDPRIAPGVGTPVPGGIGFREAHLAMEMLHDAGMIGSLQVVEANPILDERNATGALAVELICSALGQRIL
jgi:arginase